MLVSWKERRQLRFYCGLLAMLVIALRLSLAPTSFSADAVASVLIGSVVIVHSALHLVTVDKERLSGLALVATRLRALRAGVDTLLVILCCFWGAICLVFAPITGLAWGCAAICVLIAVLFIAILKYSTPLVMEVAQASQAA
jgi:hypothetical protein